MEPLPFTDLPDSADASTDVDPSGLSRYTPPTWVRSTPRRRLARVDWPPGTPTLAADPFYADLIGKISVDSRISRRVHAWANRARVRILDSVRPHLGDVDAVLCGSLAAGTHIATTDWDVDVAIRAYRGPPEWRTDPDAVLGDMIRWLRAAIDADVVARPRSVAIKAAGGLVVDVTICWQPDREGVGVVGPQQLRSNEEQVRIDPAFHRDLIAARNASLGNDSAFIKLIRIVKHLNEGWKAQHGRAPLEPFHVEVLALTACTRPFELAEGVTDFLRQAAELVRGPLRYPLASEGVVGAAHPAVASAVLEKAAERCEQALFATDASAAAGILERVFNPDASPRLSRQKPL
jgi:predicted nucleotidyltransferase